jgi:GntR family transcriptional regulator
VVRQIKRESETPPYRQLYAILGKQIRGGAIPPGHVVPPIAALMKDFGVAQGTARKAVALLSDEGLVLAAQGWRTTVRDRSHWRDATRPGSGAVPQRVASGGSPKDRQPAWLQRQVIESGVHVPGALLPPYCQLCAILSRQIRSGAIRSGAAIPPLAALMRDFGVARNTARKAVALLAG